MGSSVKRKMMTPASQRAATGRRVAASARTDGPVTAGRFPRRQGALKDAAGRFRAPRKAGFAATGQAAESQSASWSDLAAVAQPAATRRRS
jgi:hypothetical protein